MRPILLKNVSDKLSGGLSRCCDEPSVIQHIDQKELAGFMRLLVPKCSVQEVDTFSIDFIIQEELSDEPGDGFAYASH